MNIKTLQTIKSEIVAHSIFKDTNDQVISFELTIPRIILAELLTHRSSSKSTSSSRAIPYIVNVDEIAKNPFLFIAYQKPHKGMQGKDYLRDGEFSSMNNICLEHLHHTIEITNIMNNIGVTKQCTNRYLEPFAYIKMLYTTSLSKLENLFELRCPKYNYEDKKIFHSKNELLDYLNGTKIKEKYNNMDWYDWQKINHSMAEIHFQDIAEKMYDSVRNSTPIRKDVGEWHIPYLDRIMNDIPDISRLDIPKVSASLCARTSYTTIGTEKITLDLKKELELFELLVTEQHWSPLEGPCMADDEQPSVHLDSFVTYRHYMSR